MSGGELNIGGLAVPMNSLVIGDFRKEFHSVSKVRGEGRRLAFIFYVSEAVVSYAERARKLKEAGALKVTRTEKRALRNVSKQKREEKKQLRQVGRQEARKMKPLERELSRLCKEKEM